MKRNDLRKISKLIEYKINVPCEIEELKQIKEETDTNDISVYAKRLFKAMKLDDLYDALEIEKPDFENFDDFEDDDEEEKDVVSEGKISKDLFKWV